ncbi:MAG: sialidase family protein [Armatimonadota bacterium]
MATVSRLMAEVMLTLTATVAAGALARAQGGDDMQQPHADDPALVPPPVILTPGSQYGPDTRPFQGIPGIERSPGGRLWATWYGGGPTEGPWNYVMLSSSADDGATWSDLTLVIDPPDPVRAFDPCLWVDPRGHMWLLWAQAWRMWDGRGGVWAILTNNPDDEQPQWSEPRRLCDGVMMNKPIVLSGGEWLLPASVWSNAPNVEEAYIRNATDGSGSNVIVSTDEGATWQYRGGVDIPGRRCDEHQVIERRDGSLWLLARTTYGIGESISSDRGSTWSPGRPSWIPHVPTARFYLRRLASGRLILVKHSPPDGRSRSHLTGYLSDDDGRTWQGGFLLDERRGVSYPDGTEAPDGTVYVVYDFERRGAKQILMATFTEEDVLAGEAVSGRVRLRVVVNQATGALEPAQAVLADNADAEALLMGPPARLSVPEGAQWTSLTAGVKLFTDRDYVAAAIPPALDGARLLRASIDGVSATVGAAGVVWVITPQPERNPDSVELALYRQGFSRARVPEFILFRGDAANACTTFQKRCVAGERIQIGKWGVLLLPE